MLKNRFLLVLVLLLLAGLGACGQKGKLYRPQAMLAAPQSSAHV